MGEELKDRELTAQLIHAAIEVHKAPGPEFIESMPVKRVGRSFPPLPEFPSSR